MISSLVSWWQLFGCHRIRQVQAGKAREEAKEAEELAGNWSRQGPHIRCQSSSDSYCDLTLGSNLWHLSTMWSKKIQTCQNWGEESEVELSLPCIEKLPFNLRQVGREDLSGFISTTVTLWWCLLLEVNPKSYPFLTSRIRCHIAHILCISGWGFTIPSNLHEDSGPTKTTFFATFCTNRGFFVFWIVAKPSQTPVLRCFELSRMRGRLVGPLSWISQAVKTELTASSSVTIIVKTLNQSEKLLM